MPAAPPGQKVWANACHWICLGSRRSGPGRLPSPLGPRAPWPIALRALAGLSAHTLQQHISCGVYLRGTDATIGLIPKENMIYPRTLLMFFLRPQLSKYLHRHIVFSKIVCLASPARDLFSHGSGVQFGAISGPTFLATHTHSSFSKLHTLILAFPTPCRLPGN